MLADSLLQFSTLQEQEIYFRLFIKHDFLLLSKILIIPTFYLSFRQTQYVLKK